jgi:hypothetical protein
VINGFWGEYEGKRGVVEDASLVESVEVLKKMEEEVEEEVEEEE